MSHAYYTSTFAILPAEDLLQAPALLLSQDYVHEREKTVGAPLLRMHGATRSGQTLSVIETILGKMTLPALAFLTIEGTENLLPSEGDVHGYSLIDSSRQPEIIAQLRDFFVRLKADPMLARDDFYDYCEDDEIAPALERDYVSAMPHIAWEVGGDEGQGIDYLCVYLRSILKVIENAHAEGLWVVHELEY